MHHAMKVISQRTLFNGDGVGCDGNHKKKKRKKETLQCPGVTWVAFCCVVPLSAIRKWKTANWLARRFFKYWKSINDWSKFLFEILISSFVYSWVNTPLTLIMSFSVACIHSWTGMHKCMCILVHLCVGLQNNEFTTNSQLVQIASFLGGQKIRIVNAAFQNGSTIFLGTI